MLNDISQHALDIAINSIKYGAENIDVSICCKSNCTLLEIKDDGCGFDGKSLESVKASLCEPLSGNSQNGLKSLYNSCKGQLYIKSKKGDYTVVSSVFPKKFPLGDIKETIKCLFTLCESQNITLVFSVENKASSFSFNSTKIKELIKIKGIQSASVYKFLDKYITDEVSRVFPIKIREEDNLKSLEELKAIKDKMQSTIALRREDPNAVKVVVAMATCGIASGARGVLNAFAEAVAENGLTGKAMVSQSGCIGLCKYEPVAQVITPDGNKVTYIKLTPEKAKEIVEKHLVGGKVVDEYTL